MGTKRPHCRRDWDHDLGEVGKRIGFEVVTWDGYPSKRNKVLVRCAHGERWVFPSGQLKKEHCCKAASKAGDKNPLFGKATWNAGTRGVSTGHGFGFKPRGERALLPGRLYLVEYGDGRKTHFKLGITSRSTRQRLKTKLQHVIKEWEMPLGVCFNLEQATLKYAEKHGYRYSSPTTTELISVEGILPIIEFIELSINTKGHLAPTV
jgi:hypothetical protein